MQFKYAISQTIMNKMDMDWREEFLKQKEYSVALEHSRSDLMGINEELREKISSLEKGQEDLLGLIKNLKDLLIQTGHSGSNLRSGEAMVDYIAAKYIEQKMKSGHNSDDGDASTGQDL